MSEWALFKVPDVTFINLQYTDYEDDIAQVQDELGVTIHNLEDIDQYGDIDEVAALCGVGYSCINEGDTTDDISGCWYAD